MKRLLLFALPAMLAACGGGGDQSGEEVFVSGSSTVEPIAIAVAEAFAEEAPDYVVNVDGPGTGDGFQLFCNGETDISNASRPIRDEEIAACEENGVEYIELKIAFDGLTILVNPANDTLECLTFGDLYALTGPESQGVDSWSDAEDAAHELGSTTDLPDLDLLVIGPGEESGTYDSFVELALLPVADDAEATRPDYQASADDNVIIQGIEGADGALGWVGFAFAEEAGDRVKEVAVDGGDGCVAPSAESIADGSYPLSRPLYLYVSAASAAEHPAVEAYVDYFLDDGISAVEDVGYVRLPDEQLADTRAAWQRR